MNAHDGSLLPRVSRVTEGQAEAPVELTRMSGRVKWFSGARGYGFVVPDDGQPDVLLHDSCLKRHGIHTIFEGTHVVCEVVRAEKGLQVFRIVSMDETNAVRPPQPRELVVPTSGYERAVVKWFDRGRGFGFVTLGQGTEDIFVHAATLSRHGLTELLSEQTVIIRYGKGPKGLVAVEVRPDGVVAPGR